MLQVQFIDGHGNSSDINNYETRDEQPYSGVSYYRLKQIDYDGVYEYSQVKVIEFSKESIIQEFRIYPNPIEGKKLTLEFSKESQEDIRIEIVNMQGSLIEVINVLKEQNQNVQILLQSKYKAGVYFVSVTIGGQVSNRKLIVR